MSVVFYFNAFCSVSCKFCDFSFRATILLDLNLKSESNTIISRTLKVIHLLRSLLLDYDSSYSCAAVDKISTDTASRGPSAIADSLVIFANVHCVSKNVLILTCCNLDIHDPITIIFGRSITEKVRNQMMLCFPTSCI